MAAAHAGTSPKPSFDGAVLTWADLAAGPDACPDVPCAQEGRFTEAGRSGIDPVTFCELAWHGIAMRGPQPSEVDAWADRDALRAFTEDNLRTYWRRLAQRIPFAVGLSPWFPVWVVLGVSRLHHVLATGTMTSKSGAGRYARKTFDPRWHRIIDESLALGTGEGARRYRNPLARRHDALAFLDATIDDALSRYSHTA